MALVSPVIERITRPTVTDEGRKAPALRFGDLRVQALAGATAAMLFTVTGITNRSLRALMTGLRHRPYSMNQASYDLSRLARNGLIERVPGRNRYTLTRDGLLFAHIYTKVYDHVLRPLMAPGRPNAPPELAAALDTLDQLAADHITRARVPTAASHTITARNHRQAGTPACPPGTPHHHLLSHSGLTSKTWHQRCPSIAAASFSGDETGLSGWIAVVRVAAAARHLLDNG